MCLQPCFTSTCYRRQISQLRENACCKWRRGRSNCTTTPTPCNSSRDGLCRVSDDTDARDHISPSRVAGHRSLCTAYVQMPFQRWMLILFLTHSFVNPAKPRWLILWYSNRLCSCCWGHLDRAFARFMKETTSMISLMTLAQKLSLDSSWDLLVVAEVS